MTTSLQTWQPHLPISSLDTYVQRVAQVPMLSAEEEQELATRWQRDGDTEAAKQLVLSHLRFVVRIARGFSGYGLSQNDLVQEGNIGLIKAVKKFDPTIGVRLVSFAVHWIKSEIHDFILRNWRIVKVATTKAQRKLFFNLRRAKKQLNWFTANEIEDVSQELGVSTREVKTMEARLYNLDYTFDAPGDDDADSTSSFYSPANYLGTPQSDPAVILENNNWEQQASDQLHQALSSLNEREQIIIKNRWLLDKKQTLKELASQFDISLERVRQIEKSAMAKLKETLASA